MQHDQHGVDLAKPGRNSCSNRPSARCSTVLRWAAVTLLFASIQAASSCSMGHARHHLSWQRQPHAVEGLPAAAAGRHGRSLHAMVELQQTKTKRVSVMLGTYGAGCDHRMCNGQPTTTITTITTTTHAEHSCWRRAAGEGGMEGSRGREGVWVSIGLGGNPQ